MLIDPLETGTGFASFNTGIEGSAYDDLFAAVQTPVEQAEEPQRSEQSLSPQGIVKIKACTRASDSAAAGDTLLVAVSRLNVTISPCIILDVFNITLDCQGNLINGTNFGGAVGILITRSNITVKNCNFKEFGTNAKIIQLNGVNNTVIEDNNFTSSSIGLGGRAIAETGNQINVSIFRNRIGGVDQTQQLISFSFDNKVDIINNTFSNGTDFLNQPPTVHLLSVGNSSFQGNFINLTLDISSSDDFLVDNNTWGDRDGIANFQAIVGGSANNYTITKNKKVGMSFDFTSITKSTISNNSFENNGRIKISGSSVQNTITTNRFDLVSINAGVSAGILIDAPTIFSGNTLANGHMNSILVSGNGSTIANNVIENITGNAFVVTGHHNKIVTNRVYNFTGDAFRTNGTDNRFLGNNVTYIIKNADTIFNPNVSAPQVPMQFAAFLLEQNANLTTISSNRIIGLNPDNLLNGLWGIRTAGLTFNTTIDSNAFENLRTAIWMLSSQGADINDNNISNCTQRAIVIQNTTGTTAVRNNITATAAVLSTDPYEFAAALYAYRNDNGVFTNNTIRDYNIGIYVNNGSNNAFSGGSIKKANGVGIGIFSLYGIANNFTQIDIQSEHTAVKALYTNLSNFTGVNATTGVTYGYQFFKSYNNSVQRSQFAAGPGMNVSIEFSHFSANNTVNNNVFPGAADVDCLFDLFATANTGAGNGGPTQREENGASGNLIA